MEAVYFKCLKKLNYDKKSYFIVRVFNDCIAHCFNLCEYSYVKFVDKEIGIARTIARNMADKMQTKEQA